MIKYTKNQRRNLWDFLYARAYDFHPYTIAVDWWDKLNDDPLPKKNKYTHISSIEMLLKIRIFPLGHRWRWKRAIKKFCVRIWMRLYMRLRIYSELYGFLIAHHESTVLWCAFHAWKLLREKIQQNSKQECVRVKEA
jgi:hypothetical protein